MPVPDRKTRDEITEANWESLKASLDAACLPLSEARKGLPRLNSTDESPAQSDGYRRNDPDQLMRIEEKLDKLLFIFDHHVLIDGKFQSIKKLHADEARVKTDSDAIELLIQ